jgi:co-chaperonin GroES (HSP10)
MKAVNAYIVVDKIKKPENKVKGLLLTEDLDKDNRYNRGKVISVGNLVKGINNGDIIQYDKHAGHGMEWEEKLYYVVRVNDVVIIE